jgi:predicted type IV restriction endonuclease
MLSEVFGFDKYAEVTSEHTMRGTACDLAIKLDASVEILFEIKATGPELTDSHVKQAVDYAANQGVDWAVLTNGVQWTIYKGIFSKPIEQDLVAEIDFLTGNQKDSQHLALLHLLSKEGWSKSVLDECHNQKQALGRYCIAAVVLSDPVTNAVRRELKCLSANVRIDSEKIHAVLTQDVLKRDALEGEKAAEAKRKVTRALNKTARSRAEQAVAPGTRTVSSCVPVSISPPNFPVEAPEVGI